MHHATKLSDDASYINDVKRGGNTAANILAIVCNKGVSRKQHAKSSKK